MEDQEHTQTDRHTDRQSELYIGLLVRVVSERALNCVNQDSAPYDIGYSSLICFVFSYHHHHHHHHHHHSHCRCLTVSTAVQLFFNKRVRRYNFKQRN